MQALSSALQTDLFMTGYVLHSYPHNSYCACNIPVLFFRDQKLLVKTGLLIFWSVQDIAIAAMGPIQGLPDYNWFRRRTYWNRY